MRVLALFVLTAVQVCAADSALESDRGRALKELVLADLRRPFPTDAELTQRLADHQKEFEQLVAMAKADKELVRIAPDFTWTTSSVAWPRPASELGFTTQRWDEYRRLFHTLGIEAGILRPYDHADAVYLLVQTKGLMIGGSVKGYAYSDTVLQPRCDSLDKPEAIRDIEICFKPAGGKWYLYFERED
ncbi:MAG: hypothetical protein QOG48_1720 [Verrucomicrobiota bacterium]|jgi:hypothetical protein